MKLIRYTSPYDSKETLDLIEEIFGKDERELETPQLSGAEAKYNEDIVYLAKDGDTTLGMIHATLPKALPHIAGVSAMCTTEAARGKGIGKLLFKNIVEEMDTLGVKTSFLGTGNPIAAKLYSGFGFSYLPGSHVMVRMTEGGYVDFTRDYFGKTEGKITVTEGDASMRIPIIPLVLNRGDQIILDANTHLVSSAIFTQSFCMSLYPRYVRLARDGGYFFGAKDERGVLGAMASVAKDSFGEMRADFFTVSSFESCVPDLIYTLKEKCDNFYVEVADSDESKLRLISDYIADTPTPSEYRHNSVIIPTKKIKIK